MLYLVGLGLGDAKDITVRGLEIVKKVDKVYLENYTSIIGCSQEELEEFYGRQIIPVDRDTMEQGDKEILDTAQQGDVAVLVVGDPLNATTHTDLLLRAAARNINYQIIHNASIVNAVACCGLQVYNFGEIVSIPFWTDSWKPESFYDKILRNRKNGLHTLCLLDIKVKEPNWELLARKVTKIDPPRFMTVSQAAEQLLAIIKSRQQEDSDKQNESQIDSNDSGSKLETAYGLSEKSICIGLARVGHQDQRIVKSNLAEAIKLDLGPPLHSLVITGTMHPLEEDMINMFVDHSIKS